MAHRQQLKFIELLSKHFNWKRLDEIKILEIGSYAVNGTIRDFLPHNNYIGADLIHGPGVDLVADAKKIDFEDDEFDLTFSCNCFEHDPFWHDSFDNLFRMTKSNGYICITCPSKGHIEHGTQRTDSSDSPGTNFLNINYYRNISKKEFLNFISSYRFNFFYCKYNPISKEFYFIGQKFSSESSKKKNDISLSKVTKAIEPVFKIDSILEKGFFSKHFLLIAFKRVVDFPLTFSSTFLREDSFQNFAMSYNKFRIPFYKFTSNNLNKFTALLKQS